ncbi:MAG: hypothetical protein Q9192_000732 [Flavoplaca navasiana]
MESSPEAAGSATFDEWDADYDHQMSFFASHSTGKGGAHNVYIEEAETAPLFSAEVARSVCASASRNIFPQYGMLAKSEQIHEHEVQTVQNDSPVPPAADRLDKRIFLNVNAPSSAFICGSQGSGKSHTLTCMLEASLKKSRLGKLPKPLTGLLFHWDRLIEPCEAAYLCSSGIEVTVLVSPFYYEKMKEKYENLPKLDSDSPRPVVRPLLLRQRHLDVRRMMQLMAVDTQSERPPLYIELVRKTLQDVGRHRDSYPDQFYTRFRAELPKFTNEQQSSGLNQRLSLLERFLDGLLDGAGYIHGAEPMPMFGKTQNEVDALKVWKDKQRKKREGESDIWSLKPGTLTIVDLSDPLSDEYAACTLFDICLGLFMENQSTGGTILALDEAHKFMSESETSAAFTESLLSIIRLQRHYGTRVIISTQEPTISPKLLDLCSMSIVHRFSSSSWMQALKGHLAAVSDLSEGDSQRNLQEIFKTIVHLEAGQALLFSPSAMLDAPGDLRPDASSGTVKLRKLGLRYVKMRVRTRESTDGGRSKMAVGKSKF